MEEDRIENSEKLRETSEKAFHLYPNSCSHAVWYVIRQYDPGQQYMTANQLVDFIASSPKWQEIQLAELSEVASHGGLIVGGLKGPGHGHVITVYPGKEKANGGFKFIDKNGEQREAAETGVYALAMSTTMGNWPGSRSNGDKTVRDPWPAKKFREVMFWKYIGPAGNGTINATPLGQRWKKGIDTAREPQTAATNSLSSGRRWLLEAEQGLNFNYRDNLSRWQR